VDTGDTYTRFNELEDTMNRQNVVARDLVTRIGAWLGTALIVISLAGCAAASGGSGSDSGSGSPAPGRDITGNWQLVSGTDATGDITPGKAVVTFKFDGSTSGGRGPCNSFGATAKGTTIGTISIVVGIHTEMACVDADLNTTEGRYFAALDKMTKASLANETLTLTGDGDSLVFTRATT
jgi:heat shock protein HslJ